jgi:hypothetical protein
MSEHQLEFQGPEDDEGHLNILLYGAPKTGKTVGASSAPGPILYLNAERPNAVRYARKLHGDNMKVVKVKGLDTMIATGEELLANPDKWETVVIDPMGEFYRLILEGLSGRALSPAINLYGDTGTHLERFCRFLCDGPYNAVFICHELNEKDEEGGHFERVPFSTTKSGSAAFSNKLMAMVDVIGYTGIDQGDGDGPPRYLAQLIASKGRSGGDRFGALGKTREVNLTEWVQLARDSIAAE